MNSNSRKIAFTLWIAWSCSVVTALTEDNKFDPSIYVDFAVMVEGLSQEEQKASKRIELEQRRSGLEKDQRDLVAAEIRKRINVLNAERAEQPKKLKEIIGDSDFIGDEAAKEMRKLTDRRMAISGDLKGLQKELAQIIHIDRG